MRATQWYVLGIFFMLMGFWFIFEDSLYQDGFYCDVTDDQPVTEGGIWGCLQGEILDPFIMILIPLGIVCLICGGIETVHWSTNKK